MRTPGNVEELWLRFRDTRDPAARDQLIVHYSPLVKFVAGRYRAGLPVWVEQDDLISDGVMGLIGAIEKFDPDRGLRFQTYAVPRIRGAIADGLRSSDWVPRSVREKLRDIDAATAALEHRLRRRPDESELAEELEISVWELRDRYSQGSYTTIASLETNGFTDDFAPRTADVLDTDDPLPPGFLPAIRELPERDQIVMTLYYWERLSLAEIGLVLQVSESRISQLMTRATLELRRRLVISPDRTG